MAGGRVQFAMHFGQLASLISGAQALKWEAFFVDCLGSSDGQSCCRDPVSEPHEARSLGGLRTLHRREVFQRLP